MNAKPKSASEATDEPLVATTFDSPVGELTIIASDRGLRAVLWPADQEKERQGTPRVKEMSVATEGENDITRLAALQLEEYFSGVRREFSIPLDLAGTELQLQTWASLASIPYGETTTYGGQAAALGRPNSFRAVANANGKNPVSIVLPCHRVVGADGSLTGFAGGIPTKSWLLAHEERNSERAVR